MILNPVPRRDFLVRLAAALPGLSIAGVAFGSTGASPDEVSHTGEAIHQEVVFKASRKRVYEALVDTKQFNKVVELSGAVQPGMSLESKPTEISREVGGAFSLFGGHIVGRHVELVPSERIVQAWRVVGWNPGVYSIAKFELTEQGAETKLVFDHTGFSRRRRAAPRRRVESPLLGAAQKVLILASDKRSARDSSGTPQRLDVLTVSKYFHLGGTRRLK